MFGQVGKIQKKTLVGALVISLIFEIVRPFLPWRTSTNYGAVIATGVEGQLLSFHAFFQMIDKHTLKKENEINEYHLTKFFIEITHLEWNR